MPFKIRGLLRFLLQLLGYVETDKCQFIITLIYTKITLSPNTCCNFISLLQIFSGIHSKPASGISFSSVSKSSCFIFRPFISFLASSYSLHETSTHICHHGRKTDSFRNKSIKSSWKHWRTESVLWTAEIFTYCERLTGTIGREFGRT